MIHRSESWQYMSINSYIVLIIPVCFSSFLYSSASSAVSALRVLSRINE